MVPTTSDKGEATPQTPTMLDEDKVVEKERPPWVVTQAARVLRLPEHITNALFRLSVLSCTMLATYYYCQVFTFVFRTVDDEFDQFLLAAAFPWTLKPFETMIEVACEWVDKTSLWPFILHDHPNGTAARRIGQKPKPAITPVLTAWITNLYGQLFARNLFTSVTSIRALLGVQGLNLVTELTKYPIRMSKPAHAVETWLLQRVWPSRAPPPLQEHREAVCREFYVVAMCQRFTVITFAWFIVLLRVNNNSAFFGFGESAMSHGDFLRLMQFCGIMLLFEWSSSVFIWLVVKLAYRVDSLHLGMVAQVTSCATLPGVLVATHILQDTYLAIVDLSFPEAT